MHLTKITSHQRATFEVELPPWTSADCEPFATLSVILVTHILVANFVVFGFK